MGATSSVVNDKFTAGNCNSKKEDDEKLVSDESTAKKEPSATVFGCGVENALSVSPGPTAKQLIESTSLPQQENESQNEAPGGNSMMEAAAVVGAGTKASTLPFPKEGVKVAFLQKFIDLHGGKTYFNGKTTTDVCLSFLMPMTKPQRMSLCELLSHEKSSYVGIATVFISHAWKYQFLEVVEALENHFKPNPNTIIWFDLFSNNQHAAPDLDFNWWSTTFKSAIEQFGHTVMVLAPWNNPVPFTRAWCLFEIYCSVVTKSNFEVAMRPSDRASFLQSVLTVRDSYNKMLATINVEKSESFNPADRGRIFNVVETSVGFHELNTMVKGKMREWVSSVVQAVINEEKQQDLNQSTHRADAQKGEGVDEYTIDRGGTIQIAADRPTTDSLGEEGPWYEQKEMASILRDLAAIFTDPEQLNALSVERNNIPVILHGILNELWDISIQAEMAKQIDSLSKLSQSKGLLEEVVESRELLKKVEGERHDPAACVRRIMEQSWAERSAMASVLDSQAQTKEAQELRAQVEAERKQPASAASGILRAHSWERQIVLAHTLGELDKIDQSDLLYRKVLAERSDPAFMLGTAASAAHGGTSWSRQLAMASILADQGKFSDALELYKSNVTAQEAALGATHPDVGMTYFRLAVVHNSNGDYHEAARCVFQALDIHQVNSDKDDLNSAAAYTLLAQLFVRKEMYDQASKFFYRALGLKEKLLDQLRSSDVAERIAARAEAAGDVAGARHYRAKAAAAQIRLFHGIEHYSSASFDLVGIGDLLRRDGSFEMALDFYQRAVKNDLDNFSKYDHQRDASSVRNLGIGPDHPRMASHYDRLTDVLCDLSRLDEAMEYNDKSLKIRLETLGAEHSDAAESYARRAAVLFLRGQLVDSCNYREKELHIKMRVLGPRHAHVATTLVHVGDIFMASTQPERAMQFFQDAAQIQLEQEDSSPVALTCAKLGDACRELDRVEDALAHYGMGQTLGEMTLGDGHSSLCALQRGTALALQKLGQHEQAVQSAEKALGMANAVSEKARAYHTLAAVYNQQGQHEQALEQCRLEMEVWAKALGAEHPKVADVYGLMANIYHEQGQLEQSLEHTELELQARLKVPNQAELSCSHAALGAAHVHLVMASYNKEHLEKAAECYRQAFEVGAQALGAEHRLVVRYKSTIKDLTSLAARM